MKKLICLRGTPGVGKSTVAKLLSCPWSGVVIEVDAVRSMLSSPNWLDQDEHMKALKIAAAMAAAFYGEGFHPILVVDTFSKGKLLPFVGLVRQLIPAGIEIESISLWAEDAALRLRIDQRHQGQFRDIEISLAMSGEYKVPCLDSEYLVDTSGLGPDAIAADILRHFDIAAH